MCICLVLFVGGLGLVSFGVRSQKGFDRMFRVSLSVLGFVLRVFFVKPESQ